MITAPARRLPLLGAGLALASTLALAGCGSASSGTDSPASSPSTTQPPQGQSGQPAAGSTPRMPGASGEVVALSGTTAQVRNQQTGQVAVTWSAATTFTQTVDGSAAEIATGDCVVAMGADASTGQAATSITVTKPVDGSCETAGPGGFRGGSGGFPGGAAGTPPAGMPSGAPSGMPSGGPGAGVAGGKVVIGTVTAAAGSSLTVDARVLADPAAQGASPTASAQTESVDVALGSDTMISVQRSADASTVQVGVCVLARGDEDSVGAISATSIAVSAKTDSGCGFGGMGGFGDRPGQAPNPSQSPAS
ncbi:MAG: hypothetical protein LCH60_04405 [Actinobacteria bacterium]|nr:hypothetical protein [Actinomycetota bacterium]